ncbi:unnamed protein product [Gongylonema pulchrum]|uniref:Uncharacterized protein n=1 Tax=Gongylonema pulchrum TaxID=637853 RepID=A0A183EF84_9BILA|nr:unnamed protein product [Gongylonema pulchrum]
MQIQPISRCNNEKPAAAHLKIIPITRTALKPFDHKTHQRCPTPSGPSQQPVLPECWPLQLSFEECVCSVLEIRKNTLKFKEEIKEAPYRRATECPLEEHHESAFHQSISVPSKRAHLIRA